MPRKKANDTSITIGADLTVRLDGDTGRLEFASRSALEDMLTTFLKAGAAMGWQAGRHELQTTGVVFDDKEITRDDAGHIVGLRTRRTVTPAPSPAVASKAGQA